GPGAYLYGAQGVHPAAEVHLHRRAHRDDALLRGIQGRGVVQPAADHAGAVVLLRVDGPAGPEFPEHAEHTEDQGVAGAHEVRSMGGWVHGSMGHAADRPRNPHGLMNLWAHGPR